MQHRTVNSLQIIASILMLKAREVSSEEARQHLLDAHRRVMSAAAVQEHLQVAGRGNPIEIASYLKKLCGSLAESMISANHPATLHIVANESEVSSSDAANIGLIVTELVINSLKYAFPDKCDDAIVRILYEVNGADWTLSVSDNGVGRRDPTAPVKLGLGTRLVNALARQLGAEVTVMSSRNGTKVSIKHVTPA
jgi:chemotaxis protein methyltransferase CheR